MMKDTWSKLTALYHTIISALDRPGMNTGPLAWIIILISIILFFLPYALPGSTYTELGAYASLSAIPVALAAVLRERRGSMATTVVLIVGLAVVNCMETGLNWPQSLLHNWMLGGLGLIVFGLIAGHLRHSSRQLSIAHGKAQRAEEQIALAYQQQVELNALKEQFLFNVSHELRTPLTQLYGYLELLKTHHDALDREQEINFINHATRGCEELLLLFNNILDVAQMEQSVKAPKNETLSVLHIVHEVLEQLDPQKRQEHPIDLDIAEELLIQANAQYLRQILRNLLSNAFKYSPVQAPVKISATMDYSSTSEAVDSPQVCICVQDAGSGISSSDIPLLFGKFVRLKRDLGGSVRGTGLGLYISKHLVTAMGGHIWVESSGIAGQGSRFCFTLPAPAHTACETSVKNSSDLPSRVF